MQVHMQDKILAQNQDACMSKKKNIYSDTYF